MPPTNFQRLDSGGRTRGSEIKARGTEMAKKAEQEKDMSPTETSLQPLHSLEEVIYLIGRFLSSDWLKERA